MKVLSKRFIFPTITITISYITLVIYSMNLSIIFSTIIGNYSLIYKLKIFLTLLGGMVTAMNGLSIILLFLVALLTGANLTLLFGKIREMKTLKGIQLVVGGNSLLGIVGSGCAACGLPILPLLGLGGSIMYLPFHGVELSYLSMTLLGISFYLLFKNRQQSCPIQKQ